MGAALQLTLVMPEAKPRPPTLAERFEAFCDANPHVWLKFEEMALEAIELLASKGRPKRIGAKTIWENMRWFELKHGTVGDEYLLNNSYTALMARRFQREHPEHAELFETREQGA